jgi:hypothetical protein
MQPSYFAVTLISTVLPVLVCSKLPNWPQPLMHAKDTVRLTSWLMLPEVGPDTAVTAALRYERQLPLSVLSLLQVNAINVVVIHTTANLMILFFIIVVYCVDKLPYKTVAAGKLLNFFSQLLHAC